MVSYKYETPQSPGEARSLDTQIHRLTNGLTIVLYPRRRVPVAGFFVWYRVGSRNERPGKTGLSHFLEHMAFKDTPGFPWSQYEQWLYRRGALVNAFTSQDTTCYWEVLPAEHLELSIAAEGRRMGAVTFAADVAVRERTIIVAEREGSENQPTTLLWEALNREMYRVHPYGHPILGWKDDIRGIDADDLTAHWRAFYRPDNAIALAVGDFDPARVLGWVEQHLGGWPSGGPSDQSAPAEPPQAGERRVEQRRPAPVPTGYFLFRIPPAPHPDQAALRVLGAVLCGVQGGLGRSLNLGRSSRLYRALVRGQLAAAVGGGPDPGIDGGEFAIGVTGRPDTEPGRVEETLFRELAAVAEQGPTDAELARAVQQVRAQVLFGTEPVLGTAFMLGRLMINHPSPDAGLAAFGSLLERVQAVTAADVQRVAAAHLRRDQLTAGWLIPAEEEQTGAPAAVPAGAGSAGGAAAAPAGGGVAPTAPAPAGGQGAPAPPDLPTEAPSVPGRPTYFPDPGLVLAPVPARTAPLLDLAAVYRRDLPGGGVFVGYRTPGVGVATVRAWLPGAGQMADPGERLGLARFTAAAMTRGFAGRSVEEIEEVADATGISLGAGAATEGAAADVRFPVAHLALALDLWAGALRSPDFPAAEVERMRQQLLTGYRQARQNSQVRARERLLELLYPGGHPYGRSEAGSEEFLRAAGRHELAAFHRQACGPAGLIVAYAGDLEPDQVAEQVAGRLAHWSGGPAAGAPPAALPPVPAQAPAREAIGIPGKSQSDLAMGFTAVTRSHPDWLSLAVLSRVLGGSMMGRLFRGVREHLGLSYYQGVDFPGTTAAPGPWSLRMGCATRNVEVAVRALTLELERLVAEPVGLDELDATRDGMLGQLALGLETPDQVAGWLLDARRYGLPDDYLERYPDMVRDLAPAGLQAVAGRYLDPARVVTVVAGPPAPGGGAP